MDSIMREYPFGTLLFWTTREDIQLRRFVEDYTDGMNVKSTYIKSTGLAGKEKTLVLDGQQRIQTLYTALNGTYNGKEMYFDVLSGGELFQEGKDELKYDFDYFTREDAVAESDGEEKYWVLVKRIVMSDDGPTKIKKEIIAEMQEEDIDVDETMEERIESNVSQMRNRFRELDLIYYYPIDSTGGRFTDYEEILEIFVRTNSGGTVLGKSDLMFSLIKLNWADAEERFEDLLNTLNDGGAFKFDKDFVLKSALAVTGRKAQYKVEKFKGQAGGRNLEAIEDNWNRIEKSFQYLDDFLAYARINCDAMLPSYNALIPIIYFAYKHNAKAVSPKVMHNMRTWLYKSLLNANFSGQSDSIIDMCVDVIKDESRVNNFPYREIESHMKRRNRVVAIGEDIIDKDQYVVLNLIHALNNDFPNFQPKLSGNAPEIDHIFPKSKMNREFKYPLYLVDDIGNKRFLEKSRNIEKSDDLPEDYFEEAVSEQSDFFERNLIPVSPRLHRPAKFEEFVDARRQMTYTAVKETLTYQH